MKVTKYTILSYKFKVSSVCSKHHGTDWPATMNSSDRDWLMIDLLIQRLKEMMKSGRSSVLLWIICNIPPDYRLSTKCYWESVQWGWETGRGKCHWWDFRIKCTNTNKTWRQKICVLFKYWSVFIEDMKRLKSSIFVFNNKMLISFSNNRVQWNRIKHVNENVWTLNINSVSTCCTSMKTFKIKI